MTRHQPLSLLASTLIVGLFASSAAVAAPYTAAERAENAHEAATDTRAMHDDRHDLDRLRELVDRWTSARARGAKGAMKAADTEIAAWLRAEISESSAEVREAERELARSERELAQEQAQAHATHGPARGAAQKEVNEDRQDVRDDTEDLAAARKDLERTRSIADELGRLQARFDHGIATERDFQRKAALLGQLEGLARQEIVRDNEEYAEDARERAEDRRDR